MAAIRDCFLRIELTIFIDTAPPCHRPLPFLSPTPSWTIDLKILPRLDLHSPLIWPCIFLILYSWALASGPRFAFGTFLEMHNSLVSKPSPYGPNSSFSPCINQLRTWPKVNLDIPILTFNSHCISHSQTLARRRTGLRPSGSFEPPGSCWSLR